MSAVWRREDCGRGDTKYIHYALGGTSVVGRPLNTWYVDVYLDGEIKNVENIYPASPIDIIEELGHITAFIERIKHEGAALENL